MPNEMARINAKRVYPIVAITAAAMAIWAILVA
jgi:hypothetical protein